MTLDELKTGESAIILKIHGYGAFRKRVTEMGFVRGKKIDAIMSAPTHDPVKYSIMGYEVLLRRAEAKFIEIIPCDKNCEVTHYSTRTAANDNDDIIQIYEGERHTINIALIGNPNCGKTSLFNVTTGAKEHVANYGGVTLGAKTSVVEHAGYKFNVVDLPGTYSLSENSHNDLVVRRFLQNETPDVIVNVVDASNLERNLFLSTELIDMDRPMVIALNMFDEFKKSGAELDYDCLGGMIGVPMLPTVSRTGEGVEELLNEIIKVYEQSDEHVRHVHVKLTADIENAVKVLKDIIKEDSCIERHFSPRYLAIKLLEGDKEIENVLRNAPSYENLTNERNSLVENIKSLHRSEDIATMIAAEKYGFIAGALAETLTGRKDEKKDKSHAIDEIVTSPKFGFPIFFAVMFIMFWATFSLGTYPQDWIESGVNFISNIIREYMPDGVLKDLVCDGIIGGVGGVIIFLPNILILYFFISVMEDSGYMARAAFIMDSTMHKLGLHGKSFIPLVMGFGCNVPAVMASNSIESRSSRIITILINPFMSCSARLPVYVLLIGIFFSEYAALMFFGIYALGIIVAILSARLMRKYWYNREETPFVMELPPYRMPTLRSCLLHMWSKGREYLKKIAGVILFASIVIWTLNYFPNHNAEPMTQEQLALIDESKIDPQHDSYLEMIGKAINPALEPLGLSWRASVAVVTGLPAKEISVSTLGVLYTGDSEAEQATLKERLQAPSPKTGKPDFTPASALSLMIFILLYCPCFATVAAIVKECGSWKYGIFSIIYNTTVAWILAFIAYNIALRFL